MIHLTLFKKFGETIVKASVYDRDLEIMTAEGWLGTGQEAVDSEGVQVDDSKDSEIKELQDVIELANLETEAKDKLIAELQARIQELSKPVVGVSGGTQAAPDLNKKNGTK